tara:strand:+ start:954 stop:1622 length:669 start_codon:yes stop_codon:yes gene_type:complete
MFFPKALTSHSIGWETDRPAPKKGLTTKGEKMSELLFDMEADQATASSIEKMDNTGLASVAEIARAVRNQEDLVNKLDDELKEAKRELLKLTDEDLPAMLLELGLSSFELEDGSKVTVRPTYGAHIKAENKATAFDWLRQNGFDDIIKNTVSCNFGRGEDQEASQFIDYAQGLGYAAEQKTDVHHSTLKAFVKERVQNGETFPMELFGAYVGQRANIARKKS